MLAQEMEHDSHSPSPHVDDLSDTPTLKVAMEGPEWDKWLTAIANELQSIKDEKVYELVDPSKEHIENQTPTHSLGIRLRVGERTSLPSDWGNLQHVISHSQLEDS